MRAGMADMDVVRDACALHSSNAESASLRVPASAQDDRGGHFA